MRRRKNRYLDFFKESATANMRSYFYYFNRLKELAISRFTYENMPKTIDKRFMSIKMFEDSRVLFFKDDIMGFLCLPFTDSGKLSVYDKPLLRRAYASNGYHNKLTDKDSVIIYDNYMRKSIYNDVQLFASRLWLLDSIINVNANAQKTPVLVIADEKEKLTMLNVYKEYDGNAPVIFGDKKLNPDGIKVLKTDAPYVADKIYELKVQIWNEALTYLGISNVSVQKKERLVTDEVNKALGGTLASRNSALLARQEAVEEINDMFNLDIKVYFNDFIEQGAEFKEAKKEVQENE